MKYSNEYLEKTIQFWEPRYKKKLTLEDARQITENMVGFFTLLNELDRKYSENTPEN